MKKIDNNLLHQIQTGEYKWNFENGLQSELCIQILKHEIISEFNYDRIKKNTKINGFDKRLYYIPQVLIDTFNISYSEHQHKLRSLIQDQIDTIQSQPIMDWRDKIFIQYKLEPDLRLIDKSVEDIISEYILDRIYHISIPEIYKHFEKDRARIVMISEALKEKTPELKIIIDTIVLDIYKRFEFVPAEKKKTYNNFKVDKLLHNIWYNDDIINNIPFQQKKKIKELANKKITEEQGNNKHVFTIIERK